MIWFFIERWRRRNKNVKRFDSRQILQGDDETRRRRFSDSESGFTGHHIFSAHPRKLNSFQQDFLQRLLENNKVTNHNPETVDRQPEFSLSNEIRVAGPDQSSIRLETKSGRILPLTYATKYDVT